jgi:hypothetical protein
MSRTDQPWLKAASATWAAVAMRRGELTLGDSACNCAF